MAEKHILVVDDDPIVCGSLSELLRFEGYGVDTAADGEEALALLEKDHYNLVIADVSMPGMTGFDVLRRVKQEHSLTEVILSTAYGTVQNAVEAIKLGAFNYVTKPLVDEEVKVMVSRCLDIQEMKAENENLRQQLDNRLGFHNLVGQDFKMQRIYQLIEAVADTKSTVLLTGESGAGKTMIARAIHHNSSRRNGPFIEVNCGALPDTLLESELFGHVRGAFTGAISDKRGKFEAADGGTIFLDEISTATPALQVKLLRVLQERSFERVGGTDTIHVDVRVIIATNTDLARMVREGTFREDLYYRVNVVSIDMPPLRDRVGDIRLLGDHFLKQCCERLGKKVTGFDRAAMKIMLHYGWPGNVRELENVVERALVLCQADRITPRDLPPILLNGRSGEYISQTVLPLRVALEKPEKKIIEHSLQLNNWNRQKTAMMLGINRTTLFNKMRKYDLLREEVESGG